MVFWEIHKIHVAEYSTIKWMAARDWKKSRKITSCIKSMIGMDSNI